MSVLASQERSPRLRLLGPCAIIFLAALALRLAYAFALPVRVSADAAYYVAVADNLYHGRGFVVDYVWNYLAGPALPTGLPVPSNGYWMPGTSVLIAGTFALARSTSLRVAQMPFVILGALLCAVTAWIAGLLFRRRGAAFIAGAMAVFSFHLVGVSLYPDHFNLAACLVNVCLLALWAAWWREPNILPRFAQVQKLTAAAARQWSSHLNLTIFAGLLAGLAYLTRSDGALLAAVGVIPGLALLRRGKLGLGFAAVVAFLGGGTIAVFPWTLRQKLLFGSRWGAGALHTAFLTDNDDLFRVDQSHLSLRDYLDASQVVACAFKGYVLFRELRLLGAVLGVVALLAILALLRRGVRGRAAPWLIYLSLALLVPALVFPYPTIKGGFWHLLPGLCPILFALAGGEVVHLITSARRTRLSRLSTMGWLGLIFSFAYLLAWWKVAPKDIARGEPPIYPPEARTAVAALDPAPRAVLTDNCWGLYHVARVPCAQFPSDGAQAALLVADCLGADYLITRADAPNRIPAIAEIAGHARFQPFARYPTRDAALLVYRIEPRGWVPAQSPSDSRRRMSQ